MIPDLQNNYILQRQSLERMSIERYVRTYVCTYIPDDTLDSIFEWTNQNVKIIPHIPHGYKIIGSVSNFRWYKKDTQILPRITFFDTFSMSRRIYNVVKIFFSVDASLHNTDLTPENSTWINMTQTNAPFTNMRTVWTNGYKKLMYE